jgi:hypothetical protein
MKWADRVSRKPCSGLRFPGLQNGFIPVSCVFGCLRFGSKRAGSRAAYQHNTRLVHWLFYSGKSKSSERFSRVQSFFFSILRFRLMSFRLSKLVTV